MLKNREENKERINEQRKQYREKNKEKIKQMNETYREKNKEKINEKRRLKYHLTKNIN